MIPGYIEFEFKLADALLIQLVATLNHMSPAPLGFEAINTIPGEAQGVYQLFLDDKLTYIGKTDAKAGLRRRLERHSRKTQSREGLDPARVTFKAVRVLVFTAVDLETQLIASYGGASAVPWNGSGFGSNDPGHERDTTNYKDDHFDARFPIDIDRPLAHATIQAGTAAMVLQALKDAVPYVIRFETQGARSRKPHAVLATTNVSPSGHGQTARAIIRDVVRQLPEGWQATKLPSHVILYREERTYPRGEVIARSIEELGRR